MVPVICYIVVMMVSMAIVITVYAVVMLGWCRSGLLRLPDPSLAPAEPTSLGQAQWSPYLRCTFKYTKRIENPEVGCEESEEPCAVCLSGFEEGQNACQLPKCNHSFHSTCIDTWLYSHSDCPVCRAPVDRVICWNRDPAMVPGKFC